MRQNAVLAAVIFAVALSVRLIFLLNSGDVRWPHSVYYEGDAPAWAQWAACLNHGQEFERGLPLRSPGVAYLLHWLSPTLGESNYLAFKVLWCIASAATCALLFLATVPLGRRAALLAAAFLTFSFGSYVIATSLNNETPYALAIVLSALATVRLITKPSLIVASACGVLHGLATLLRPEHSLLLAVLMAWLLFRRVTPRCIGRGRKSEVEHARLRVAALKSAPGSTNAAGDERATTPPSAAVGRRYAGIMLAAFVLVCLPWSIGSSRALRAFNDRLPATIDAQHVTPPWSSDALAYLNSMPPFVRSDNFEYLAHLARQAGEREVTLERVRRFFERDFGYVPEPLPRWFFISPMGPLNFALANHPAAAGGFSKAALDARLAADPPLTLTLPSHLELVNRGYAVGWEYIRGDPAAWLRNVGRKLSNFAGGLTSGLGATNWPLGREGVRRAVDVLAPGPGTGWVWKGLLLAILASGALIAVVFRRTPIASICVLVLAYKLIVTILFFGYARQGLSIAPLTVALTALAIDAALRKLDRWPRLRTVGWSVLAVGAAGLIASDIVAARSPATLRVIGPAHLAPQWGPNAFEASGTIELKYAR